MYLSSLLVVVVVVVVVVSHSACMPGMPGTVAIYLCLFLVLFTLALKHVGEYKKTHLGCGKGLPCLV